MRKPWDVKLWCLGNEMDGPWQIGHMPPENYAILAQQSARMMKMVDPTIELVVCGSCAPDLPTYLEWDRKVLEHVKEDVEFLSVHRYVGNEADDTEEYLAVGASIDRQLDATNAVCLAAYHTKKTKRRIYLSVDEWNVWYRARHGEHLDGAGKIAPALLEEHYNLEDALVAAQFLNSFIRHADSVKIANLAQIVNVIAPILTRGDEILLQSIFYPIEMIAKRGAGTSLQVRVDGPGYTSKAYGPVKTLDASAILDGDRLSVSLVNRSTSEPMEVCIDLADRRMRRGGERRDRERKRPEGREHLREPEPGGEPPLRRRLPQGRRGLRQAPAARGRGGDVPPRLTGCLLPGGTPPRSTLIPPLSYTGVGMAHVDVAIIGGGPAGSTTGSFLRKYGNDPKIMVLERETFPRDHVGESGLPSLCRTLDEIGVWDKVEAAGFPIKVGATYKWGKNPELWNFDFVPMAAFDAELTRPGTYSGQRVRTAFQVDRAVYDEILLDHAAELGCEVRETTRVVKVHRAGDRVTGLELEGGEILTAEWYIDASGHAGILRRAMDVATTCPTSLQNNRDLELLAQTPPGRRLSASVGRASR